MKIGCSPRSDFAEAEDLEARLALGVAVHRFVGQDHVSCRAATTLRTLAMKCSGMPALLEPFR